MIIPLITNGSLKRDREEESIFVFRSVARPRIDTFPRRIISDGEDVRAFPSDVAKLLRARQVPVNRRCKGTMQV